MGIHKLNDILKKYAPNCIKKKYLKDSFAGKKIAIDTSLYIFKYKAVFGERWINSFISLFTLFDKYKIKSIIVFDNPKKTSLKKVEIEKRGDTRKKLLERISELEKSISLYNEKGEVSEILKTVTDKSKSEKLTRLLSFSDKKEEKEETHINIDMCIYELEKLKSQIINITPSDISKLKELCDCFGVDYVTSESEAEASCVYLSKIGVVDSVLSEDTDVLAYGCKSYISKLNISEEYVMEINYDEMLEELKMKGESFLDMCILLGCDFNKNIKGVGPETSYKLISKLGSVSELEKLGKYDISCLNYKELISLFNSDITIIEKDKEFFKGEMNKEKISTFCFKNRV